MRKLYLLVFLLLLPHWAFGAVGDIPSSGEQDVLVCDQEGFVLSGKEKIVANFPEEFNFKSESGSIDEGIVTFTLLRDGQEVEKNQGSKYIRIFNKPGTALIKAELQIGDCLYSKELPVTIYEQSYIYIGEQADQIENNFSDFFEKKNTLFTTLNSKNTSIDLSTSQGMNSFINFYLTDIEKSNVLFIDESLSVNFFDALLKIQKIKKDSSLEKIEIFILTGRNYSFLSKVLAPYMNQMGITKIGFIQIYNFLDSINSILSENIGNISYTYFDRESNIISLNTFLRYLTYSGFELSFLGILLAIALAILVVNFSKQFIGLNAFGVYYPILLALCLTLLNISFVSIFLLIGFFSIFTVFMISKKTHLLYYSKRSLLMVLFIIYTLIFLGIDNYFTLGIIDINTFGNKFIVFPLIFLLLVADKVLHEEVKVFSKKGMVYFFELILITFISYFFINSSTIQYFLLSFPDSIFIIFGLNILVGRYTGLQLIEIIRFKPLINKLSEEE